MFANQYYFNVLFQSQLLARTLTMQEIIECNYKNETNDNLQKSKKKSLQKNIEIYVHLNFFLDNKK